jgi:hypothetical protein
MAKGLKNEYSIRPITKPVSTQTVPMANKRATDIKSFTKAWDGKGKKDGKKMGKVGLNRN